MIKGFCKLTVVITIVFLFLGCAGTTKYMQDVTDPNVTYAPGSNEAVVVFMRPSTYAYAIQSAVFDVTTQENQLVGIVSAKKKVAYRAKPGKYMFMVLGESADFMQAKLEAGKTYYATVNPRMGAWKARFSLGAVHQNIDQAKLNEWKKGCSWVETTDTTYQWAEQNAPSIQSKRDAYIEKWNNKPDSGKPTLYPEDGF